MLATANNQLASSLFCYTGTTQYRPVSIPNILEAANNARRRWPDLAGMVDHAVVLVENNNLSMVRGNPNLLALCRPVRPDIETLSHPPWHVVSQTATGLGCTCRDWPPAQKAGPGDGLYCPDILATLLQIYLDQSPHQASQRHAVQNIRPLPYSPEALWQEALKELQYLMTQPTFTSWLAGSRAIPEASRADLLVVAVANRYAQEWLTYRLQPVIDRVVTGLAGYDLSACFVITSIRSDLPRSQETNL